MGHCKLEQNPQRRGDHVFPAYEPAGTCLKVTTPTASSVSHYIATSLGNTHLLPDGGEGFTSRHLFSPFCVRGMRQAESVKSYIDI